MNKCGSMALDIKTYYAGLNQPTHPNIIFFQTPWHGYHFYMAYTPYPYANGFEENPCIATSNDLIHWEKPNDLINPIATSEELACDELKDSHLLYREDLDRLELWYLGRINGSRSDRAPLCCLRKISTDGRTWSNHEIMYTFSEFNLASQSVIYNGSYLFWGIRHDSQDIGLYFMKSEDGFHWSTLEKCDIPDAALTDMWHGTVILENNKYHIVWVGHSGDYQQHIYYANSDDGYLFSKSTTIVNNDTGWDFLYRPCLIEYNNHWYCYYGVIRCDGKWLISMSHGEILSDLKGVTAEEIGDTFQQKNELLPSYSTLRIKQKIRNITKMFAPRLLLISPLLIILGFINFTPLSIWIISMLCCAVGSIVLMREWKCIFLRSVITGTAMACISVFLSEIFLQLLEILRNLLSF